MNINSFKISTAEMPSIQTAKQFIVNGEVGAQFQIIALESGTLKYYDFENQVFEAGHNDLNNNLIVTLFSTTYTGNITFPSGGGNYVIKLMAINGTKIKTGGSNIISKAISKQASTATVTFQAATTNTDNYQTFPTVTSTGTLNSSAKFTFDWDIKNASTDAGGFGLVSNSTTPYKELNLFRKESKVRRAIDNAWYFETTETVDGAVAPTDAGKGFEVKVDDLTNLVVGMTITGVSGGDSLSGTPFIKKIDIENKILHISTAQTFSNDVTLTFKAYGSKSIFLSTGAAIRFGGIVVTPTILTKTVRANVSSSVNITLTDTHGIAGGEVVTYGGAGVNNSATNRVAVITTPDCPDLTDDGSLDNDGVIEVELAQTLKLGTVLYFKGSFAVIKFAGTIGIQSFPETDKTIYFDIDKFLSVGAET